MNTRKRWENKAVASAYATQAVKEGHTGLGYCAACDYLGWNPVEKKAQIIEQEKEKKKKEKKLSSFRLYENI